jgi:hypothetical protein
MNPLPGIGGTLFPGHFLASKAVVASRIRDLRADAARRHFVRWWERVAATCGPATGVRALFDRVAMPLASLLGYRAHDAVFERDRVRVRLVGTGPGAIQLTVLPWATRPSRRLRDVEHGILDWVITVAPPFVSIADVRGHAFPRSIDFHFPDAIDARSFHAFWMTSNAGTLLTPIGHALLAEAESFQDEVRQDLQLGVVRALGVLEPVLARGSLTGPADVRFAQALTLVYRILFLLFAESRALAPVHHPLYGTSYAVTSLCREAVAGRDRHAGIWDGMAAITRLARTGCDAADLVAQPFNGRLFARASAPALESGVAARPTRSSARRDEALAEALIALATRPGQGEREAISYADLGVEQLGAVYERVLDLDPRNFAPAASHVSLDAASRAHSRRRKETGTFYTPQPLAEFVVRRTLGPLVHGGDGGHGATSDDILALRVLDPAMGSGAFLVAACRFLSDAYERALVAEGRCAETDFDADSRAAIRRLVASRCLAGVDANPVAVQLARLSLWLTTLARDKPLSFFDHQLRCGDSLIGASPDDLWRLSDRGRHRSASTPLFEAAGLEAAIRSIARPWRELRGGRDDTIRDVRDRERCWAEIEGDRSPVAPWRMACDFWCARWCLDRSTAPSPPELRAALDRLLRDDRSLSNTAGGLRLSEWSARAREIARHQRFFHWPLEFADLFYDADGSPRARPGFHAVIGNPPWEMLRGGDPARRNLVTFIRESGLYPSCDRGHLNLYQPFLERSLSLTRPGGRVGLVLPWGLAADEGAVSLRRRLLTCDRIDTIVGLDNGAGLFPIHRGLRFMVLVASPGSAPRTIRARFGVRTPAEIDELPGTNDPGMPSSFPARLDVETIRIAGGISLRIPDARNSGDLEWLVAQCRRFPALADRSSWNLRFGRELNATDDRDSFGPEGLPILEGKHIAPYRVNPGSATRRITPERAAALLPSGGFRRARLAYRDVAGVGNRFTLIASIIPAGVVTTHTLFCLRNVLPDEQQHFLCALFNSSPLNRIVRMLMGGHVTTALVEHLPVPRWTGDRDQRRLSELAQQLAQEFAVGDEDRRIEAQREIDARAGRLYNSAGA